MRILSFFCIIFTTSIFLGGCSTVPQLEYEGAAIAEIVQRIKCELAFAIPLARGKYPTGPFQWMRYWTAKVDLTLNTNEQSGINPTMNFIDPMTQVVLPGVGTFSRMFNV